MGWQKIFFQSRREKKLLSDRFTTRTIQCTVHYIGNLENWNTFVSQTDWSVTSLKSSKASVETIHSFIHSFIFAISHKYKSFSVFFFFISRSTLKPQNSITSESYCLKTHFSLNRKPGTTISVFKLTIRARNEIKLGLLKNVCFLSEE